MDGPRATVETDVNSFTLTIRDAEDYPKYQLAVAEWALDLSQATVLPDYPIDFSSPLTTFTASGLNPGRRFQVCALCCVVLCCVAYSAAPRFQPCFQPFFQPCFQPCHISSHRPTATIPRFSFTRSASRPSTATTTSSQTSSTLAAPRTATSPPHAAACPQIQQASPQTLSCARSEAWSSSRGQTGATASLALRSSAMALRSRHRTM